MRPVGASEEQATDIRLLSATHKNLAQEVEAGRFRQDLYYRVNVIDVLVPSLRERSEDIPELANSLLQRICERHGESEVSLDKSALDALKEYNFPGNVRELENVLERTLALADGQTVSAGDLEFSSSTPATLAPVEAMEAVEAEAPRGSGLSLDEARGDLEGFLENIEREVISTALEECRWNKTATAKLLGISFRSLRYRQKKLGLEE